MALFWPMNRHGIGTDLSWLWRGSAQLAGAQLLTRWSSALPERRHRRCRRFMVAVSYVSMTEPPRVIRFRDLQ